MSSLTSALSEFTKRSEFSKSPSATGASDEPPLHTNKPHLLMRARRSLGKAVPLVFTGYLMAIFIGAGATLAWQSYGGAARQTIAGWFPQLGWLAPPASPVAQTAPTAAAAAAASFGASPGSLKATSLALAAVRQSVDKLATELNKLQAQGTPEKTSQATPDKTSASPRPPSRRL